jgi:glycosyltransferase involved in cell wall biosynthesis
VALTARLDATPVRLAETYAAHHVVCQPSRGEGFGLCPLEALACGVPIVATACTGHSEWFTPQLQGAVKVEHGPDAPIDDGPGAMAPTVEPDAIAAALSAAYTHWDSLNQAAAAAAAHVREHWAWSAQLAPLMREFAEPLEGLGPSGLTTEPTGDDDE